MDRARGRKSHSNSSGGSPNDQPSTSKRRRSSSQESQRTSRSAQSQQQKKSRGRPAPRMDIIYTKPASVAERKTGKSGANKEDREIQLVSNYFPLQTRANWSLFAYHVRFEPDIEVRQIKARLLREFGENEIPPRHFFDGSMLRTATRLERDLTVIQGRTREELEVTITIKFIKVESNFDPTFHQHLNLILRTAMRELQLQQVGRHLYDAIQAQRVEVGNMRLDLWPGYSTSIRLHDGGLLMNADSITKVMRRETLADILREKQMRGGDFREQFTREIIGSVVLTDYNNQTYKIMDVDFEQTPESSFETRRGPQTYIDYYNQKYQIRIRDPRQPLLIAKPKERRKRGTEEPDFIALIPELCRATGLTDSQKSDNRLMKQLSTATRLDAPGRVRRLQEFNHRLRTNPDSMRIFKDWQMNLEPDLVRIQARQLQPEMILFDGAQEPAENADWTRLMRDKHFHSVASLPRNSWHVIVPRRLYPEVTSFIRTLQNSVRGMNFRIGDPEYHEVDNDSSSAILDEIHDILQEDPRMIMIFLMTGTADRYSAIKRKTCVDNKVPTQVIQAKTLRNKGLMSVATKVGIQMNSKLGFNSWYIKMPLTELMMVGYDITHDTKNKKTSYGALVASMHHTASSCIYFSTAQPHHDNRGMSESLSLMMTGAVRAYRELHGGALPTKIIFYRDGVSDGQLQYVYEYELEDVRARLMDMYGKYNDMRRDLGEAPISLRFAFIVVNKKVNTKFFKASNYQNPSPGTVVDSVVTLPERYDFMICSQHIRQGTVSPTVYNVIYDSISLPPAKLQILTFKACHLYYNWSGTVRVPAVVQYARKLAFLCGQFLHRQPHPGLGRRLYFL